MTRAEGFVSVRTLIVYGAAGLLLVLLVAIRSTPEREHRAPLAQGTAELPRPGSRQENVDGHEHIEATPPSPAQRLSSPAAAASSIPSAVLPSPESGAPPNTSLSEEEPALQPESKTPTARTESNSRDLNDKHAGLSSQCTDILAVIAHANSIFDVMQTEVITYSDPGGDFIALQNAIAQNFHCISGVAHADRPTPQFDLVVSSGERYARLTIGDSWVGNGQGYADLPAPIYDDIRQRLNTRREAPGPNLLRADFEALLTQKIEILP